MSMKTRPQLIANQFLYYGINYDNVKVTVGLLHLFNSVKLCVTRPPLVAINRTNYEPSVAETPIITHVCQFRHLGPISLKESDLN